MQGELTTRAHQMLMIHVFCLLIPLLGVTTAQGNEHSLGSVVLFNDLKVGTREGWNQGVGLRVSQAWQGHWTLRVCCFPWYRQMNAQPPPPSLLCFIQEGPLRLGQN